MEGLHCRPAGDMLRDPYHQDVCCSEAFWAQEVITRCFSCPSGICLCGHHTEGPSCERCLPGFYGNPFAGRADDCQPCPCPGQSACTTIPESREVVCIHCPLGQRGEWRLPWGPPLPWAPRVGCWVWSVTGGRGCSLRAESLTSGDTESHSPMARAPGICEFVVELGH